MTNTTTINNNNSNQYNIDTTTTTTTTTPQSAINKTKYLFLNQLFTRLITFSLNTLVARSIGPILYGYATIQLHLPYTIILYICREGLRRATLRYSTSEKHNDNVNNKQQHEQQNIINITWLLILLSLPITYIVLLLFNQQKPEQLDSNISYNNVILLYTISAIIEMLSEPIYLISARLLHIKLRALIDSISVSIRCILIYILIKLDYGVYAYVYAQLIFTISITVMFVYHYINEHGSIITLLPRKLQYNANKQQQLLPQYIEPELWLLTRNFTIQSIEKLVLTEGEKFILVYFNSNLTDHGVYSIVSNLGSLVARFAFQPLEESSYNEFSLWLGRNNINNHDHNNQQNTLHIYNHTSNLLSILMKFVILLSLLLLCIGPNYSYLFFDIIYGSRWSHTSASQALSYYFIYILVISLNGLTESYLFASITSQQLYYYNIYLLIFSSVYIALCIVLLKYGVVGLIIANSINMTCRIVYSCKHIHNSISHNTNNQQLAYNTWYRMLPNKYTVVVLVMSYITTSYSFYYYDVANHNKSLKSNLFDYAVHVLLGGITTVMCISTVYKTDRQYIRSFIDVFRHKKK